MVSQEGWATPSQAQDAVEVYEDASAQRLLDTLSVGSSFRVLVIKVRC